MTSVAFYDREEELAALEGAWRSNRAEWFILWGRRRVGKTELLAHFLEGKRGLLFEAAEGTSLDQLRDFSWELGMTPGGVNQLLAEPVRTWQGALAALDQFLAGGPAVIAIDEYQRVKRRAPEIGGLLNTWWRRRGRTSGICLVLSGSEVSFFQRELLGVGATEYGRRTGQLQLRPFDHRSAGLFFPSWPASDRMRAYAVCGGMPYYLEQFDPGRSIGANILSTVLLSEGVLREEARLLLYEELPDPAAHFSILRALATGCTRINQIVQRTGLDQGAVVRGLDTLQSLFLVERRVPVTEPNPDRTKRTRYQISDSYLGFWFRFVHPYQSRIETRSGAQRHLEETVLPQLDHFVSRPTFERAAQAHVARVESAAAVGEWWGGVPRLGERGTEERQVDVVAVDADRKVLALGSCKWTNGQLGIDEEALLARLEHFVPNAGGRPRHYFFSRDGFTPALLRVAEADPDRYRLVTPADMYGGTPSV
jgi:AAA+ ATPase superfamily predicted ATPase